MQTETRQSRINANTTLEDLTDAELLELTVEEQHHLADLMCARAGIALAVDPGPAPEAPQLPLTVDVHRVTIGYGAAITMTDAVLRDQLMALLVRAQQTGALVKTETVGPWNASLGEALAGDFTLDDIQTKTYRVAEKSAREAINQEIKRYQDARKEWDQARDTFRKAQKEQEEIRDRVREAVDDAWQAKRRLESARAMWTRYVQIADGDENMALRFMGAHSPAQLSLLGLREKYLALHATPADSVHTICPVCENQSAKPLGDGRFRCDSCNAEWTEATS